MGTTDRPSGVRDELYQHSALGLQFAATLGVFGYGGHWLDGKWGTGPWLMIVGIFGGFGLGLLSMVRKIGRPRKQSSTPKDRDPR